MIAQPVPRSSRLIKAIPFFYGWVVLVVGTIGIVMMGPSQTYTVSVFLDALIRDLHISRASMSLVYGLATLGGSLLLPITGRLVDRYGTRRLVVLVAFCLGLGCMAMSRVQGLVTVTAGFLAIRFLGFGSLQLVSNNLIAQWFIRQRGRVMGLASLSLSAGLIIFPALAETLIASAGWRAAWVWLGLLVWVVMLPLGWLFFRDRPELYGLRPDGDPIATLESNPALVSERHWTLAEARRTGVFWLFSAGLTVMTMVLAALAFHQVSLFQVRGLSREVAVGTFQVMALFAVVGNLGMGWLLDRTPARLMLSLTLFTLAAAMVLVQVMATPAQAMVYVALVGLVNGCFRVLDSTVWAKYFGRLHLGSIRGATMIGVVGGSALGPYPLGASLDYLGSYNPAMTALIVLPVGIGLAALLVKRPNQGM